MKAHKHLGIASLWFLMVGFSLQVQAGEENVLPPEAYRSTREHVQYKRLKLDLSVGYGVSYSTSAAVALGGFQELEAGQEEVLDRLGLTISDDLLSLRLTGTYAPSRRVGFFASVPVGVVQNRPEGARVVDIVSNDPEVGLGDMTAGTYFHLLDETRNRPTLAISVEVDTDTSRHTSLGDGLWSGRTLLEARKFVSPAVYLVGAGEYSYRPGTKGLESSDIAGVAAGLGFRLLSGQSIIEIRVKDLRVSEYRTRNTMLVPKDSGLVLTVAMRSLTERMIVRAYASGLEDGVSVKQNNYGFALEVPLFPRR